MKWVMTLTGSSLLSHEGSQTLKEMPICHVDQTLGEIEFKAPSTYCNYSPQGVGGGALDDAPEIGI